MGLSERDIRVLDEMERDLDRSDPGMVLRVWRRRAHLGRAVLTVVILRRHQPGTGERNERWAFLLREDGLDQACPREQQVWHNPSAGMMGTVEAGG